VKTAPSGGKYWELNARKEKQSACEKIFTSEGGGKNVRNLRQRKGGNGLCLNWEGRGNPITWKKRETFLKTLLEPRTGECKPFKSGGKSRGGKRKTVPAGKEGAKRYFILVCWADGQKTNANPRPRRKKRRRSRGKKARHKEQDSDRHRRCPYGEEKGGKEKRGGEKKKKAIGEADSLFSSRLRKRGVKNTSLAKRKEERNRRPARAEKEKKPSDHFRPGKKIIFKPQILTGGEVKDSCGGRPKVLRQGEERCGVPGLCKKGKKKRIEDRGAGGGEEGRR